MAAPAPAPAREAGDERTSYAQMNGISNEEAGRRLAAREALHSELERLLNTLRSQEANNFLDVEMVHQPDWGYVFYFKRNPAATLARHTANPRFSAAPGGLSQAERQTLIEPWVERWREAGIPFGFGLDAVRPTLDVRLSLTAGEYAAIATANGWDAPPAPIVLEFDPPLPFPAVDPRVASMLRGFAHEEFGTGMQMEALATGRLLLRDGCLKFDDGSGEEKLAVFHRETGVALDDEGRLVLIDRATGAVKARVGERIAFSAPNPIPERHMIGLTELRAQCPGEPFNVGNPESEAVFTGRHGG